MKLRPVIFAIVSMTTLSSTLLKSSCTSPSGVAGTPGSGPAWASAAPAQRPAASRAAVRPVRRITRGILRWVGVPGTGSRLRQVHVQRLRAVGAVDLYREAVGLRELEQDLRALLGAVDADPVELRDHVAVLQTHLLEDPARLDRGDLDADHLALGVLRQDAGVLAGRGRSAGGGRRDLGGRRLRLRWRLRRGARRAARRVRARLRGRRGGRRGLDAVGLLERELAQRAALVEHDAL